MILIVGTLLFSNENHMLCFLAVDIEYRRRHFAERMVSYMLTLMDPRDDIIVTLSRGATRRKSRKGILQVIRFCRGNADRRFWKSSSGIRIETINSR